MKWHIRGSLEMHGHFLPPPLQQNGTPGKVQKWGITLLSSLANVLAFRAFRLYNLLVCLNKTYVGIGFALNQEKKTLLAS